MKNEPCQWEEEEGGCYRYNKKGQGIGQGQCPYQHSYARIPKRPRPAFAPQQQRPPRPPNPAQRNGAN